MKKQIIFSISTLIFLTSFSSLAQFEIGVNYSLKSDHAVMVYSYHTDEDSLCPELRTHPEKRELKIDKLFVDKMQQKKGHGKALVIKFLKIALEHKGEIDVISLDAAWGSGPFWQRMGFRSARNERITDEANRSFEMFINIEEVAGLIQRLENSDNESNNNNNNYISFTTPHQQVLENNRSALVTILLILAFLPGVGGLTSL